MQATLRQGQPVESYLGIGQIGPTRFGSSFSIELTGGEEKLELAICSLVYQAQLGKTDDVMIHHIKALAIRSKSNEVVCFKYFVQLCPRRKIPINTLYLISNTYISNLKSHI